MVSKSKLRSPFTQIPSQMKATAVQINVRKRSMNSVPNSGGRVAPNCTRILPSNVNLKLLALHLMAKCHPQPCTCCDQRYHHTGLSHDCLAVRTLTPASSSPGQCSQPHSPRGKHAPFLFRQSLACSATHANRIYPARFFKLSQTKSNLLRLVFCCFARSCMSRADACPAGHAFWWTSGVNGKGHPFPMPRHAGHLAHRDATI